MTDFEVDMELDVRNLQCPMPLLKAKLALNNLHSDQVLKVLATDPGSEKDFHLFVSQSDPQILDFQKDEHGYYYWIRKG
mgnify:CR=1 FL=1